MLFSVVSTNRDLRPSEIPCGFLVIDNWDDWFEFSTLFSLIVFDEVGTRHEVGGVKIGQFGMSEGQRRPALPESFQVLDERFFSVGQDDTYYQTLGSLGDTLNHEILIGLRDCAHDLGLFERALNERVMTVSLLRSVSPLSIRTQFRRLTQGGARLTRFSFSYQLPIEDNVPPLKLTFKVEPHSHPPTNIHALIGRNGVGKTRCLNMMTRALAVRGEMATNVGVFAADGEQGSDLFANLVSVTFSAFDPFLPIPEQQRRLSDIRYSYIGLKRAQEGEGVSTLPPKSPDDLTGEFIASVRKCRSGPKAIRWRLALEMLEADPLFREAYVTGLTKDEEVELADDTAAGQLFQRLSAGHKIVLLTITRLVETVDERTLVLVDEPEAHLHPPLLAAFVRALSDLLVRRNGVAIIATHSPVVLQEAPRTCVWILRRSGVNSLAERPEIETFGENVGVLTREVFGLEVTQSGFHRMLEKAVAEEAGGYQAVLERFGGQLGNEAKAIIRGLNAARESE